MSFSVIRSFEHKRIQFYIQRIQLFDSQERLFYASEAFMMIEHLDQTGKIEQTGSYHVYRITPPKA
jgi:hypothetical protein